MRGLHSVQIGRQWYTLVTANAAGAGRQRKKEVHPVKVSRHCYITTSSSQEADLERGTEEERVNEGLEAEDMVSVQFRGNEITVPRGSVLRTALLQHGFTPHSERAVVINCRGLATCGTCAVQIEGSVIPSPRGVRETVRLNMPPHTSPQNSNLRLACQVRLDGDVKVTKYDKFWGQVLQPEPQWSPVQGSIPLGPTSVTDSVTPLGDLEFLLDFEKNKKI